MQEYKTFWERVQSAPEAQKRRWMIITTAVVMVVVIYIWLAYFNNLVAGFSVATPNFAGQNSGGQAPVDNSGGITMWSAFKDSLANLYQAFLGRARDLGNILQAPREYIVNPPK